MNYQTSVYTDQIAGYSYPLQWRIRSVRTRPAYTRTPVVPALLPPDQRGPVEMPAMRLALVEVVNYGRYQEEARTMEVEWPAGQTEAELGAILAHESWKDGDAWVAGD